MYTAQCVPGVPSLGCQVQMQETTLLLYFPLLWVFFGLCPCLGVNSMYAFPALGSHVQIQYATFRCYGLVPYP